MPFWTQTWISLPRVLPPHDPTKHCLSAGDDNDEPYEVDAWCPTCHLNRFGPEFSNALWLADTEEVHFNLYHEGSRWDMASLDIRGEPSPFGPEYLDVTLEGVREARVRLTAKRPWKEDEVYDARKSAAVLDFAERWLLRGARVVVCESPPRTV